ncbi:hypothetical protein [Halomonas shantousis]
MVFSAGKGHFHEQRSASKDHDACQRSEKHQDSTSFTGVVLAGWGQIKETDS